VGSERRPIGLGVAQVRERLPDHLFDLSKRGHDCRCRFLGRHVAEPLQETCRATGRRDGHRGLRWSSRTHRLACSLAGLLIPLGFQTPCLHPPERPAKKPAHLAPEEDRGNDDRERQGPCGKDGRDAGDDGRDELVLVHGGILWRALRPRSFSRPGPAACRRSPTHQVPEQTFDRLAKWVGLPRSRLVGAAGALDRSRDPSRRLVPTSGSAHLGTRAEVNLPVAPAQGRTGHNGVGRRSGRRLVRRPFVSRVSGDWMDVGAGGPSALQTCSMKPATSREHPPVPMNSPALKRAYWRRWLATAWDLTRAFWGVRVTGLLLAIFGPTIGLVFLLWVSAGTLATLGAQLPRVLLGPAGTLLILAATYLGSLLRAPGVMERAALEAARAETERAQEALADAEARRDELAARMDAAQLRIEVRHEGDSLRATDTGDEAKNAFLAAEKSRLLDPLVAETKEPPPGLLVYSSYTRDIRSNALFREEVQLWLTGLLEHWTEALRGHAIERAPAKLRPVVRNLTEGGYEKTEIQLRLPGDLGAGWSADSELIETMPWRPKPWGKNTLFSMPDVRIQSLVHRPADPGTIERVGDALVVSYEPFDLTAARRLALAPVLLFLPKRYAGGELLVEWSAAAQSPHQLGRVGGEISIPVSADLTTPGALLLPNTE